MHSKVCPGNEKVDHKLKDSKRAFRGAKRRYFNDKTNIDRRIEFIKTKKTYKKIIYLTEKYNKMDKLSKLAEIESKQPNLFWKTIKSLMPRDKNKPNISSDEWVSYFKNLLNIKITLKIQRNKLFSNT